MVALRLEYVLTGRQRGYQFTSDTRGVPPEQLKRIWRHAIPRGSSWSDPAYRGARALKCFALDDTGAGRVAVCDVIGTDQVDEVGRTGIRRAEIHVMTIADYDAHVRERLARCTPDVTREAERRLNAHNWELLLKKQMSDGHSPLKPQTVFTADYSPENWQIVEACLLLLATRATLLTNLIELTPKINPFADRVLSFTTLALDARDESRLVAIPAARAAHLKGVPFVALT
jgi:hypothetical protein